ncbi:MAG: NAD(P)/FAD-dependent oxidoreductase [Thioalkalispiraceae bacterium]|jgi:sulfide dehydrogenase [flavocytochrome c] flavoprotein subunit
MSTINRRKFLKLIGGTGAAIAAPSLLSCNKAAKASARVVIVGGGFGGATCAKYLKRFDPRISVTLIEPVKRFTTCPFSNAVLGDMRNLESITHGYDSHQQRGITVIHAMVTDIEEAGKAVRLDNGKTIEFDRLVLSPGIDFRWEAVEGMQVEDISSIPHAWQGGPQTILLSNQLKAMPDGGVVIVAPPGNPFRCPPGPYERVSLIAHYLKQHKPKSKILILDAKEKFSKQPLFMQGWQQLYPGMIEWVSGNNGGRIERVDVPKRTLHSELGDRHRADVINFIPPQKAGAIAHKVGLVNNDGWCPVNQRTFESTIKPGIHVIGDASVAGAMPKSGFAANSQGKVCAAAIVTAIHGTVMPDPSYVNTCYSLVAPDYGISVAAVYRHNTEKGIYKVEGSGGVSPKEADAEFRNLEARYAKGWYDSITSDVFG